MEKNAHSQNTIPGSPDQPIPVLPMTSRSPNHQMDPGFLPGCSLPSSPLRNSNCLQPNELGSVCLVPCHLLPFVRTTLKSFHNPLPTCPYLFPLNLPFASVWLQKPEKCDSLSNSGCVFSTAPSFRFIPSLRKRSGVATRL